MAESSTYFISCYPPLFRVNPAHRQAAGCNRSNELGTSVPTLHDYMSETDELRPDELKILKGRGGGSWDGKISEGGVVFHVEMHSLLGGAFGNHMYDHTYPETGEITRLHGRCGKVAGRRKKGPRTAPVYHVP
ncbi:MAG: hypothetical protein OXD45_05140 [Rhodobacteraceae bacterium]|nr:hypothetical protein [Paracoccaceae bacterium]